MMKVRIAAILSITLVYFGLLSRPVLAHILASDKSIGAVMHIDPEDNPIVGQPSFFFFEFKDKTGKFDPANCDCKVSILESNKQIYTQDLFAGNPQPNLSNSSFSYIFSHRGVYNIQVSGTSVVKNSFPAFTLQYDVRVSRVISQPENTNNWWQKLISFLKYIFERR